MTRRKNASGGKCISNCSAYNRFYDISIGQGFLPDGVIERLREKGVSDGLKRCSYCGTIWTDVFEHPPGRLSILKIGVRNIGSGDEMHWFI